MLLVEDEPSVAEIVATALQARDLRVRLALTGLDALDLAAIDAPDLIVLDLGLPDIDGLEVCRRLREWYTRPIIVLSADGSEDRKIAALDHGADDYVTKPFSMPELLARVRVALRHGESARVDDPTIRVGDVEIDVAERSVAVGGTPIELTNKEFGVLVTLALKPGKVLTHTAILDRVWGVPRRGTTESLRVHVTYLRKKLGDGPDRPRIATEPGVGYRLVVPDGP